MNIKSIVFVIFISLIVGVGIYYFTTPKNKTLTNSTPKEVPLTTEITPSPSPLPSEPPIDKSTDLQAEIKNQVAPDFSPDYKKLKEEVDASF
jgi:hypothetical protein